MAATATRTERQRSVRGVIRLPLKSRNDNDERPAHIMIWSQWGQMAIAVCPLFFCAEFFL